MSPQSNQKTSTWSAVNLKTNKHVTSMSCKLEPAIWSHDPGQQIPCFDRCQLIIAWMSNIKKLYVNQSCTSLSTFFLEYGRHVGQLRCRRRHAYAPTSYTASHENHKKIPSWISFSFTYENGAPHSGPLGHRSSAINRTIF